MSLFIAPPPPGRWDRLLERWRRWRWRRHGGLSPRWQEIGMIDGSEGDRC